MEAQALANELGDVRDQIATLEAKKKEIEEALMYQLKASGLRHIRTDYGETVSRAYRSGYWITGKMLAFAWAEKKKCTKVDIDMKRAGAVLDRMKTLPDGFEKTEIQYLRMIKPKEDGETTEDMPAE